MLLFAMCFAFVDIVQNDIQPAKPNTLKLVLEFVLGDGSKDDLFFAEGVEAVANEKGIFVLDPTNHRVVAFDKKGQVINEFGKQGQGPGEFQGATGIAVTPEGKIAVFDTLQKRLNFFSPKGEFTGDLRIDQGMQHVSAPYFLKNGNIVFMSVKTDAQFQMTYDYSLYDSDMNLVKKLESSPLPPTDWSKAGEPNFWVDFLKHQFEAISAGYPLGAAIGDRTHFVMANSKVYQGQIMDQAAQPQITFAKKYRPKGFTEQAKFRYCEGVWEGLTANAFLAPNINRAVFEKAHQKSELPDFVTPISFMISLGDGFAVVSNYDIADREGILEYFDATGQCRATGTYQGPLASVYGFKDRILAVGPNDEDAIVVNVFRVNGLP